MQRVSLPLARVIPGQSLVKICCAAASTQSVGNAPATQPFSAIPGPKGWPLLGNVIELRRNVQHYKEYYHSYFKKYGDIYKFSAFGKIIVKVGDHSGENRRLGIGRHRARYTSCFCPVNAGIRLRNLWANASHSLNFSQTSDFRYPDYPD